MGSIVVVCTVLVSTDDVSTSLFVVDSLSTCEVRDTASSSAGVLRVAVVAAVCSAAELAGAAVLCVVVSVVFSLVSSVVITEEGIGVLSAFGDKDEPAVVEPPLMSSVLIVSAFGLVVIVVSSLVGADVIATVAAVLSASSVGLVGAAEVFVSLVVLFVSGARVGNWSFSKSKP